MMIQTRLLRTGAFLCLVLGYLSPAAALDITVLDSQYTTFVSAQSPDPYFQHHYAEGESISRFQTSQNVLSDYAYAAAYPPYVVAEAEATANPFSTSAFAQVGVDSRASAYAKTELTFSPSTNAVQAIELTFSRSHPRYFSEGYASLTDITTNEEYWRYGWSGPLGPTGEWDFFGEDDTVSRVANGNFYADHVYSLKIYTGVLTSEERKWLTISLAGLQVAAPIPEPEAYAMMLAGLLMVGAVVSWTRRATGAALVESRLQP